MLKGPLILASFGLALNLFLSGIPGMVAASGAESEALQVAGAGLQQPPPADLAPRADAAGAHVLDAAASYIRAAQALLPR